MRRALTTLDVTKLLPGARVVVRSSLNVPVARGTVTHPLRAIRALDTLALLARAGARTVVLGHIGRAPTDTLRPVADFLRTHAPFPVSFGEDCGERARRQAAMLAPGEALIVENVRQNPGEEKNDPAFAAFLAGFGDLFVNDAFSDAHRVHASVVGIPALIPSVAGPQFMREYDGISPALNPHSPSLAIVGGAKFVTKTPLIKTFLKKYDHVFVCGALANDLFLAKGYEVGRSVVSRLTGTDAFLSNSKLLLPTDVVVQSVDGPAVKHSTDVAPTDYIHDAGPASLALLAPHIAKARTIVWNGPLGNFERGFRDGTEGLARLIASAPGVSIVGGGDTVAAIEHLGLNKQFTFVSTAGGAMLQFIADGTLPGIEALTKN